jgi:HSP20 family protein
MTLGQQHSQQRGGEQPAAIQRRRWDPLQQMEDMYQTMGSLLQDFLGDNTIAAQAGRTGWSAPADVEETDDAFVVELDLPGVKPEDISVELRDTTLRVSGEIKERQRAGILRRSSRRVGRFEHIVTLPGEIDANKVDAKLADGVLTVRIAKSAGSQPRRIDVKRS